MDRAVDVHGLRRRLGGRQAVADVSLRVAPGELHAVIGANGAGKTTLMRLLAGLVSPDAGEGEVLGFDVRRHSSDIARAVGYAPQSAALHPTLTVEETLRFRAAVQGAPAPRIASLLSRFELGPWRRTRIGALSGGWARRVQLASTLVHAPRLLLLDEPAGGLDHEARGFLWREIAAAAQAGAAVVLNTHDPAEAEPCDRVTVLAEGAVRAHGSPSALVGDARLAVFDVAAADALPHPWRARAERWSGGGRLVLAQAEAEGFLAAMRRAGVEPVRGEVRLEHAWPALLRAEDRAAAA